ncbi:MAG: EAL domain-containing protein [Sphingomicrobium sp.]
MPWDKADKSQKSPIKLLAWVAVLGLLFGLTGFGQLFDDILRTGRNRLHMHKASGDIVLVKIDDRALQQVGRWPWPRRHHAELIDKLTAAGAKRVFFDVHFETRSSPAEDQLFADAIQRAGNITLPVRGKTGPDQFQQQSGVPIPLLRQGAHLASISIEYNYQNAVWHLPRAVGFEGGLIPSFASSLAGAPARDTSLFTPDYSVDPRSVPTISAGDVLTGVPLGSQVKGKDVLVGATSEVMGDLYFIPGIGKLGGAYVQIVGAETLKAGKPVSVGWMAPFILAFLISAAAALFTRGTRQAILLTVTVGILLIVPVFLEARLITVDIAPALFVTLTTWGAIVWRRYRRDGVTNAVSGLPNLAALKMFRKGRDQALNAARILNYAEVVASLPAEAERNLVDQIVGRLTVGAPNKVIYHGDGGIFAWFEDPPMAFGHHIDALHTLFRNPVRVNGQVIDLSVTFGVEIGSGRSLPNRLASALVAAEEAAHDGLKWKIHDPEKLSNASWKLSLLSRLDQAIDEGEVWVAYQPKLDLATQRIIGAEALARWTHPEKGPIAASEFIAAAEQHDRIGKLTDFVLDQAIGAAASINASRPEFHIAVNLSARLLADKELKVRLTEMLLKHRLEPQHLTLELTETSALGSGEALQVLASLRDLGVQISIDDYGTGLSTLDYLKKVPAAEIKIDQSFVKGLTDNRSDRVMVQSTIALAHSLGRIVVAEGVERRDVLDALIAMKCDVAQGFIIGRPMSINSLVRRLASDRKRSVA